MSFFSTRFLASNIYSLFSIMYMCLCWVMCTKVQVSMGVRSHGARVIGNCGPLTVDAENQTPVICKSSMCSYHWTISPALPQISMAQWRECSSYTLCHIQPDCNTNSTWEMSLSCYLATPGPVRLVWGDTNHDSFPCVCECVYVYLY